MKLIEALSVLHEMDGRTTWYMRQWGQSTIKRAIYTVLHRKSATADDIELARKISDKLAQAHD